MGRSLPGNITLPIRYEWIERCTSSAEVKNKQREAKMKSIEKMMTVIALTIGLALPAAALAQATDAKASAHETISTSKKKTSNSTGSRELQSSRFHKMATVATITRNTNVNVNANVSTGANNQTSFPTTRDPGVRRHSSNSLGREL
jgi:hypothetical protein